MKRENEGKNTEARAVLYDFDKIFIHLLHLSEAEMSVKYNALEKLARSLYFSLSLFL